MHKLENTSREIQQIFSLSFFISNLLSEHNLLSIILNTIFCHAEEILSRKYINTSAMISITTFSGI